MCRWSLRTGWSWSPEAYKEVVSTGRGVRPATVCRSILFSALLATEAFVHRKMLLLKHQRSVKYVHY